jgi:hypothetical protein
MDRAVRLSTRNKVKPTPYTPYKYEGYKLNKKKALDKKVQQCIRSVDVELQYKHGNYVLEMSLAAYELLKGAIKEYFHHHDNYTIEANDQQDQQGLCVSTSYFVRNRKNNKQQYRINLYHTTCRAEVNGHGREQFLLHLQDMAVMMDNKGNCSQLNKLSESPIRQCMDSMTQNGSMSASNSSNDGPLVPISHSPHRKDVTKKASRGASIATIQHNSTRASGDASLVTMQHHSTRASEDAPLAKQHHFVRVPVLVRNIKMKLNLVGTPRWWQQHHYSI